MDTPSTGYLRGLRSLERELVDPVPLAVEGTLPPELRGTLYRVGPGRCRTALDVLLGRGGIIGDRKVDRLLADA